MRRDTSVIFIALADLLLCVLAVVIVAVNPPAVAGGVKSKAEYLITAEWSIEGNDPDVDLWAIPPPGDKPVYFRNREAGLTMLDQDCLGRINSTATLTTGQVVTTKTCRETMTLRGIVPGHYDIALNLYHFTGSTGIEGGDNLGVKVHLEITQVNPTARLAFVGDVVLDRVRQTVNVVSFELDGGSIRLVPPPATPITDRFQVVQ